jgi:ubiquinone biosynthesis protein COQ9
VSHGVFHDAPLELVLHFVDKLDAAMKDSNVPSKDITRKEKLKELMKSRIEKLLPYADTWSEALAILAQPKNVPTALHRLATTADEICHLAGDTSAYVRSMCIMYVLC